MDTHIARNLIIRYAPKLGLSEQLAFLLWHLLDHDFNGKRHVWPSIARLAERIGRDERTVQRRLSDLNGMGFIKITYRDNNSNDYDVTETLEKLKHFYIAEAENSTLPVTNLSPPPSDKSVTPPVTNLSYEHSKQNTAINTSESSFEDSSPVGDNQISKYEIYELLYEITDMKEGQKNKWRPAAAYVEKWLRQRRDQDRYPLARIKSVFEHIRDYHGSNGITGKVSVGYVEVALQKDVARWRMELEATAVMA